MRINLEFIPTKPRWFGLLVLISSSVICADQPGSVQGAVTDTKGRGFSNVVVWLRNQQGVIKTTGDNTGGYSIKNVPAGRYSLTVSRMPFAPVTLPKIDISAGESVTKNFQLTIEPPMGFAPGYSRIGRFCNLSGVVRDQNGLAIPQSEVRVGANTFLRKTIADKQGRYEFSHLEEGRYFILPHLEGYQVDILPRITVTCGHIKDRAYRDLTLQQCDKQCSPVLDGFLTSPLVQCARKLEMNADEPKKVAVSGRVIDETGIAIAGVKVNYCGTKTCANHRRGIDIITNEKGQYEFIGTPSEEYWVKVDAEGFELTGTSVPKMLPGESCNADIVLQEGVTQIFLDCAGVPARCENN